MQPRVNDVTCIGVSVGNWQLVHCLHSFGQDEAQVEDGFNDPATEFTVSTQPVQSSCQDAPRERKFTEGGLPEMTYPSGHWTISGKSTAPPYTRLS